MAIKDFLETPPWEWPGNAGKQFLRLLRDRKADPADRLVAAQLAGDSTVVNDELAAALLQVAGDPAEPENLRTQAVISLGPALELVTWAGGFEDDFDQPPISEDVFHRIQSSLEKIYRDASNPKLVRRRSLEAAVRAGQEWHQDAVREAYASDDREWVLTAVFAMTYVPGFDQQIVEALNHRDPEIHLEAVRAAGERGIEAAWPHVLQLVEDRSTPKDLLIAAIEAVGGIRPAEAEEVLEELSLSEDTDIQEAVSEALTNAAGAGDFDEEDEEDEDEDEDDEDDEKDWVN